MTRVATTGTSRTTRHLAAALTGVGLEAVHLPCVAIEPAPESDLDNARRAAERADLLFVTSATTATLLWSASPPTTPAVAVGPATAAAIRSAGGAVESVGDGGAIELARLVAPWVAGRHIVWAGGQGRAAEAASLLASAGAAVEHHVVYRTRSIAPPPDPVDAVIFGSPSAVRGWTMTRALDGQAIAALGPTTAAAIAERGGIVDVLPDRPDADVVAADLAAFLLTRAAPSNREDR